MEAAPQPRTRRSQSLGALLFSSYESSRLANAASAVPEETDEGIGMDMVDQKMNDLKLSSFTKPEEVKPPPTATKEEPPAIGFGLTRRMSETSLWKWLTTPEDWWGHQS